MARRVLAISSYVASGNVGLRPAISVLAAAGFDVIALPTIILSSHLGHARASGRAIALADFEAMIAALEADGALDHVDAVLTGYMPTASHVAATRRAIACVRRRNSRALIFVDPIMGDDPDGLYVDEASAVALAAELVPLADVLTPNRFELARLAGAEVTDIKTASAAMVTLGVPMIAATSILDGKDMLATMLRHAGGIEIVRSPRASTNAHGAGDLFATLLLLALLQKRSPKDALATAVTGVSRAIKASGEALDLALHDIDWRSLNA